MSKKYQSLSAPVPPFPMWLASIAKVDRENRVIYAYLAPSAYGKADNIGVVSESGGGISEIVVNPIYDFDEVLEWMHELEQTKAKRMEADE